MRRDAPRNSEHAAHLTDRLAQLSAKRQEIIRPILEHPRGYVLFSVRALAKRCGTDPATIVRIVRGLGFSSYHDFQRHLHELSLAFATSADTMRSSIHTTGITGHISDSLDNDIKNLQGLKNSLDRKTIAALAKRLYEARRILILAGDLAATLSDYFEYQISLLGLPVFSATCAGRIVHLTRALTVRDLVLAISFRRGLRQTVEGARLARERGAHCVAITDTYLSPLARICHDTFLAGIESTSFGASYAAPVAVLNAILAAAGQQRHAKTLLIAKAMSEEQRRGSRWHYD